MSGKRSRTKGHSYERDIAKAFREVYPGANRLLEYQSDCANGVDLRGTGALRIQCKRTANWAPITKIEEVKDTTGMPVLVTKGDRKRSVACLYLDDFIKILKDVGEAYDAKENA